MNSTTKSALKIVFTLVALHLVLLTGAVLMGTPTNQLIASYEISDGRNWMWVPVFFWAVIPTVMMLSMPGIAVWVSLRHSAKQVVAQDLQTQQHKKDRIAVFPNIIQRDRRRQSAR